MASSDRTLIRFVLALLSTVAWAFAAADECGDPRTVSQSYEVLFGIVDKVPTGDTIVVRETPRRFDTLPVLTRFDHVQTRTVRLVNVDAPIDSQAMTLNTKAELSRLVLGKNVSLLISPFQGTEDTLIAIVEIDVVGDVGEDLLTKGLVTYRDFGPYAIDWWLECHYKAAVARAKAAKVGVWANER